VTSSTPSALAPRRRRAAFAAAAIALAVLVPVATLLAVDVYLHRKYSRSAGYNVWGYRGPIAGAKASKEYRVVMLGGSTAYGYGVNAGEAIPAVLERDLAGRSPRPVRVINLAYNNEGAYSFVYTLRDYAYLDYDLVILYEGYNDMTMPARPNLSVFRHESPVFRLTGYLPIFPIVFKEKAAAMLHGGDAGALYRDSDKTVFRPGLAARVAAGALQATAEAGSAAERGLGHVATEPARAIRDSGRTGCSEDWRHYCEPMRMAIEHALDRGKQVIVVTQPYLWLEDKSHERHVDQQTELAGMMTRLFASNPRVQYVNFGRLVDTRDTALSFDGMHLTPDGNRRVAAAFVAPVLRMVNR
jgi:lysophospholipase L1-like esterase